MTRVFVYGSLLSGERNHGVLSRARLVGEARTEPNFSLHDLGSYPAMVAGGIHSIAGEVYEVDDATLARLDHLEGHPRYYCREAIALVDDGKVETYLLPSQQVKGAPLVASGDWRKQRKEKGR